MPEGDSLSICIRLLGRFEIIRGECVLRAADWTRRKPAALLACLALKRRLTKDQAIDLFWPDNDLHSGANNLYRTLHELRQTLNKFLGPGSAELVFGFEDGILSLDESVWVDAVEFERLCSPSNEDPDEQIASLEKAITLYQGDLLPHDLYSDWTQGPRERLWLLYREASLALAVSHRQARDYMRAIALLLTLVSHDPADEAAQRELMRVYALTGRRHEALRQYQMCVDALAKEFDAPPEPETSALYAQIQSRDDPNGRPLPAPRPTPAAGAGMPSLNGLRVASAPFALQPSACCKEII